MDIIKVALEYFHPWPNSAGFYTARYKGWFKDAGLDVRFYAPDAGYGDSLAYLTNGQTDFAIAPSNRLLVRHDQGEAIKGIAAINHRGLESIQTITDYNISRPKDLEGRRLALNPTPRGVAMVRHLIKSDGGNPDKVTLVDAGCREMRPEELAAGRAEASFGGYWAWEALMPSTIPDNYRVVLPIDQYNIPRYHSYQLCTSQSYLEKNSEIVRKFLTLIRNGYLEAISNPDTALHAYEEAIPYFPQDLIVKSLKTIAPTWLDQNGIWDYQNLEIMHEYASWLKQNNIISSEKMGEIAVDNSFLPSKALPYV
ncbi:ABC transporter substrate-binding protein [Zymomonas mobilis]|uniref:ABC transporter substrate-binding protein n=1 Tax=Zymomonas mobilis TaxID=542 RepID=UPI00078144B2|nr:ABC transporter substrate-binding protein [Zymomonas mobilis]